MQRSSHPPARPLQAHVASLALLLAAACGGGAATNGAPGADVLPPGVIGSVLPPIPEVFGSLRVYVEYPDSLQRIAVSDTNFIFGNVGTGDAALTIDGRPIEVNPNGTFLAWVPVPPRVSAETDSASYLLVATRGAEVDSLRHWILLPARPFEGEPGTAWIDPGSLETQPERWALPDEPLSLNVRATPGAVAWLQVGASELEMPETGTRGIYRYTGTAGVLHDLACAALRCAPTGAGAGADSLPLGVRIDVGEESVTDTVIAPLRILDPLRLPVAELREPPDASGGPDGVVHGRPAFSGTYRWRLANGTRAPIDGKLGDRYRLRLAPDLEAWVDEGDVLQLPAGSAPATSRVGDLRFEVRDDRLTLSTGLAAALPIEINEPDPYTLELTFFGATGVTDRIAEGAGARVIERIEWTQLPGNRYRLRVRLTERVWGHRTTWRTAPGGGAQLAFEIRRPPPIDPAAPLRGRRIAIDPGHPGAGAHGPSGYYEGDANLAIGRILARLVAEAGGEPILIRDDTLPMGLYERTNAAIEAGGEVFVSIHNNALPDGVQPVGREGTSTYHYHPHSHALAVAVQQGMLRTMGLRDLGVYWGDLAVTRMSWMPSVLAEGAFMMIPSHEAALMTAEFQEAYARGVLEGIAAFLAEAARGAGGAGGGRP